MERIPNTETQAEREGRLISSLSKTKSITYKEVAQLRSQRLQDILDYGKKVTVQFTIKPKKNVVKKILSHLIY